MGCFYSLEHFLYYPVIYNFDLEKNKNLWDELPFWKDIINRDYRKWSSERLVIDTANKSESQKELWQAIEKLSG